MKKKKETDKSQSVILQELVDIGKNKLQKWKGKLTTIERKNC